jgi:hypothetical protein
MQDIQNFDLTNIEDVVQYMSLNYEIIGKEEREEDWRKRCHVIKFANEGGYPERWFNRVIENPLACYKEYYSQECKA